MIVLPPTRFTAAVLFVATVATSAAAPRAKTPTLTTPRESPAAAVESLLAADRAFAAASARTTMLAGLTAMMGSDVVMPVSGAGFAEGIEGVGAALRGDTLNIRSIAEWAPVRGGVSADGTHGLTFGFITLRREDGTLAAGKYLAYWIKGTDGWRVAAYKRGRRAPGPIDTTMRTAALPLTMVSPTTDAAVIAAHRESLAQAERAFSRDAQVLGLGPAFARYGSADAMNLGGPSNAGFVYGNEAIATLVGTGVPAGTSPVTWAPDHRVLVASSGDFGVTIGFIRPKAADPGGPAPAGIPFFTIWRRASAASPWRYVAE